MKRRGDIQHFFIKKKSVDESRDSTGQTDSTDSSTEGQGQPECSQAASCVVEPNIQGQSSNHEPPGESTDMRKVMHLYLHHIVLFICCSVIVW